MEMECNRVEKYRQPQENDEYWAKRKYFIQKYWNEFKEHTLLCLAQVYADVELHGCRCPIPTLHHMCTMPPNGSERTNAQDNVHNDGAESVDVSVVPPNSSERTDSLDRVHNDGLESVDKGEPKAYVHSDSGSGTALQKRPNSEVSGMDSEESSPSRKKVKTSYLPMPFNGISSDALVENGSCNYTTTDVYKKSLNSDNETELNSVLIAMQKPEVEDFQSDLAFRSAEDEVKQSYMQMVQESNATSEGSPDQAMDTEPVKSSKASLGNMNNNLEICLEAPSVSKIEFDEVLQISGKNAPQDIVSMVHSLSSASLCNPKVEFDAVSQTSVTSFSENITDALHLKGSHDSRVLQTGTSSETPTESVSGRGKVTDAFHVQGSHDSGVLQMDTVPQTLAKSLCDNLGGELNSSCSGKYHGFRIFQFVPKNPIVRTGSASPQNSGSGMVVSKSPCNSNVLQFETLHGSLKNEILKLNFSGMLKERSEENSVDGTSGRSETMQNSLQTMSYKSGSTSSQNCSSKMSEFDMLPQSLKDNFTDILHSIWKLRAEGLSASEMLERISKMYNLRLDYNLKDFHDINDTFECSLEIDGVSISKGEGPTIKGACRVAGRLAFDKLMLLSTEAEKARSNYCDKPYTSSQCRISSEPEHRVPDPPFIIDLCGDPQYATSVRNKDVCVLKVVGSSQNANNEITCSSEKVPCASDTTYGKNFCGFENLTENLKTEFIKGSKFILRSLAKQLNPVVILSNVPTKLGVKVEFKIKRVAKNRSLAYECSLLIGDALVSKAQGKTSKKARFRAASIAVDELKKFLQREKCTYSVTASEESNSRKKRKQKKKKKLISDLTSHDSNDSNQNDSLSDKRNAMSEHSGGSVLHNGHMYENFEDNPHESTGSPLKPLNRSSVVAQCDNQDGFIPLNRNARQDRFRRDKFKTKNNRQKTTFRNSKIFAIIDYSDVTKKDCYAETLVTSASFNNVQCNFQCSEITEGSQQGSKFRTGVMINKEEFCTATGKSKKISKEAAAKQALDLLKTTAYTVQVKCDDFVMNPADLSLLNSADSDALPETNIGYKMLKGMGWTGGGLGRPENRGIEEPIEARGSAKAKCGLGFPEKENDRNGFLPAVEKTIQDYINQSPISKLIFSSGFRPWQRKIIQRVAKKHYLWFRYFHADHEKYAVVSRHFSAKELVTNLLLDEGRTCNYELVPPSE